jgi:[NiFe] hydrogenase diaphorase moiety large subunit
MDPDPATILATIIARHGGSPGNLLQILRDAQDALDWLSPETSGLVAKHLDIPVTRVEAVVQFYAHLYDRPRGQYRVLFSDNITDRMAGAPALMEHMLKRLRLKRGETSADGLVSIDTTSCTGMCDQGPALLVNNRAIPRLTPRRIDEICDLIRARAPLADWPAELFQVNDNILRRETLLTPLQRGVALDAAIARGAKGMMNELRLSKLRGRGGAGFPTAKKFEGARDVACAQRYIVCNADEGEPGTFKDRVLLNSYSVRVLEGMAIAALAVGATKGFIYLRGEYTHLRQKLQREIDDMRASGRLGVSICGAPGFDFDIEIHMGAGGYICGEGTALVESLEGKPGRPRVRPPSMVQVGYRGLPTVVDNVETLAHCSEIAIEGGASFAKRGTKTSTGTKLVSVSGDCEWPGIYEYQFGVTIGQVLEDCGAHSVSAVQIGGASGVLVTPDEFGRHIAFEDVSTAGAFMIFGRDRDIFEVARNFAHFFAHESCGFCTPCRVGTAIQRNIMDKIAEGRGSRYEINELMRLSEFMRRTSHCGLGETAGKAVRDALTKFRPAFERYLGARDFAPAIDLEAALEPARRITQRDDSGAHLMSEG